MTRTLALAFGLLAILLVIMLLAAIVRRSVPPVPRPAKPKGVPSPASSSIADTKESRLSPARPGAGRIEGRVSGASTKAIGDIVDKHTDEAVSVLRRWIRSDDPKS